MKRNVFVVGLDDFHRELLGTIRRAEAYEFLGLIHRRDIVRPREYDMETIFGAALGRLESWAGRVDAIIGYWDFPTSTILPILRGWCGLPGPDLETVLRCEHKYWSRLEQERVIPGHIPRYCVFDPFSDRPREQIALDYPFWVKPVKSHSSYLGFEVSSDAELDDAIARIRAGIAKFAVPFAAILDQARLPAGIAGIDGRHCIAEEIIAAADQCTLEGYVLDGEARVYATIDSVREGDHRSSFRRYQYPSRVPPDLRRRMCEIVTVALKQIGFDHSPFNAEFFYDADRGTTHLLELNPRISKSHCPLFHLVDGASHQQVAVEVALGREPDFPRREGAFPYAAKFMLRHHEGDAFVRRLPWPEDIARMREVFPELRMRVHARERQHLSDLPLQEPYSYELAEIFLGGDDPEDLKARYRRCLEMLPLELEAPRHTGTMRRAG